MEPMDPQPPAPTQSSTGLASNVGGALAYLFGPITGLIFLLMEKNDRFVRFHAAQSIGIFVAWIVFVFAFWILSAILTAIPVLGIVFGIIGVFVSLLLSLAAFCLWLFLMYKAYSNEEWEFPWVGRHSRQILLKG